MAIKIVTCLECEAEALAKASEEPAEGSVADGLTVADGWIETKLSGDAIDNSIMQTVPLSGLFCGAGCVINHFGKVAAERVGRAGR